MKPVTTYPDQFGGFAFSGKEIDALVRFAKEVSEGSSKMDARHFQQRNVRRFLSQWELAFYDDGLRPTTRATSANWNEWLPVEALWRVVGPMLRPADLPRQNRQVGYSIRKHAGWKTLGLWTEGERWFGERDERAMMDTLDKLARDHYIYFQYAGNVWEVTERKDRI